MSAQTQNNQVQTTAPAAEPKTQDKEINFRLQEQALKEKYERQLAQERAARLEAEKRAQELATKNVSSVDDDDTDEPYVDHKRLRKQLDKFGEQTKKQTQSEVQKAVQEALVTERKQNWLKQNPDFYDVLQHAEKLAMKDPELADTILEMPDGFERQKLVYKNIKALGLHKPEEKKESIQDVVDANRKKPYYMPSGIGTSPYMSEANFSETGQKQAYDKMKELQKRFRLG